jgi:hypothetical protein
MTTIASTFKTWWSAHQVAQQPTSNQLIKIDVTDLSDQFAPGIEYVTGLPLAGANGVLAAPMNVTVAIKWLTGSRGRSFRGRTYHCQLRTDMYVGSTINPGDVTGLATNYAFLLSAVQTAGWQLAVTSYRHNNVARLTALTTFITGLSIDSTIDSQRRRLPGRGR